MSYNGWANYETWNVALWIGNDEGLYHMARRHAAYSAFVDDLKEIHREDAEVRKAAARRRDGGLYDPAEFPPIAFETPDGVSWTDSGLDTDALDEMMEEL